MSEQTIYAESETANKTNVSFLAAFSIFVINGLLSLGLLQILSRTSLDVTLWRECTYSLIPVFLTLFVNFFIAYNAFTQMVSDPKVPNAVIDNLSNYYRKPQSIMAIVILLVVVAGVSRYCEANLESRGLVKSQPGGLRVVRMVTDTDL